MSFPRARIQRFNESTKPPFSSTKCDGSMSASASFPKADKYNRRDRRSLSAPRHKSDSLKSRSCVDNTKADHTAGSITSDRPFSAIAECTTGDMDSKSDGSKPDLLSDVNAYEHVQSLGGSPKRSSNSGIPLPLKSGGSGGKSGSPRVKGSCRSTSSSSPSSVRLNSHATQSLEAQFKFKKRRLELMTKELTSKQKPIRDLYQVLVDIKNKLEEAGIVVELNDLPGLASKNADFAGGESCKNKIDPRQLENLKSSIKRIPMGMLEFGRELIHKRCAILHLLGHDPELVKEHMSVYERESDEIENHLQHLFQEQEQKISDLVSFVQNVAESSNLTLQIPEFNDTVEKELERTKSLLKKKEEQLLETTLKLQEVQTELAKKTTVEEEVSKHKQTVHELKHRIRHLETELENEKKANVDHKSKTQSADSKFKAMRNRLQEIEAKNKESEHKINELQKKLRNTQDNLRVKELQWNKEKDEYIKNLKTQENLLHKLTSDRTHYETRVKTGEELLRDTEKRMNAKIEKLTKELDHARNEAIAARTERETMKKKCEFMDETVVKMSVRNKQAVDLVSNRKDFHPNGKEFDTEREAEMYTELLATRVALKDYEDKLKMYEKEKLRFIDTIEKLNGDGRDNEVVMGETLVKQEETITRLECALRESEKTISEKTLRIEALEMEVSNLQLRLDAAVTDGPVGPPSDMMKIMHEGKVKLNEAMKKSLEHEQRIMQYEHEMDKQGKQINEMENLLKVRDGLIGMLKAKKDELLNENDSLRRYANEVRNLLLEAKEDLRSRTEMIQELSMNLDNKDRTCHRLEKKVRELEGTLSITNEKRFKLQDTIGTMEKELQNTKAHINQMADMHARYAPGMQQIYANSVGSSANNVAPYHSLPICSTRRPKTLTEDLLRASIANMDIIRKRLKTLTRIRHTPSPNTFDNAVSEYSHADAYISAEGSSSHSPPAQHFVCYPCSTRGDCIAEIESEKDLDVNTQTRAESLKEFIDHAYNISQYEELLEESVPRKHPVNFGREVSLCHPTASMHGILVARDVVAHSLSKIRENIENSILLVSKSKHNADQNRPELNSSSGGDGPVKIKIIVS